MGILFQFFACGCPAFPTPFIWKDYFSTVLCSFIVNLLSIYVWVYLRALNSVPLICESIFLPTYFSFDYSSEYVLGCIQLFVTLWAIALQAPLSMEFSRQDYFG